MSEHEVKYTLTLKDLLTGKIKQADNAAKSLHDRVSNIKGTLAGLAGIAGIAFGGFAIGEMVHKGLEEFHELHKAEAQVRAGLLSTREAAGLTYEELETGAKGLSQQFAVTQSQVADMQSQLLTFPSVTKETFSTASLSIIDMSTRLHKSLNETAIMVGKALQDPARGITALRRVGVNFNETQTSIIKKLAETGHAAAAQKLILKELQVEFAGSAKAAADADPLFRYHKIMEEVRLTVGGVAMKLQMALAPALIRIATLFKNTIEWMQQHKTLMTAIAIGVGVVVGALAIYETVMIATSVAAKVMTVATWLLNAAFWASPITWVVGSLAILAGTFYYAYKHSQTFRAGLMGLWEFIKEFGRIVADVFIGLGKVIHGTLTFNPALVLEGGKQTIGAIANTGVRLGAAFHKGFNEGMADFAKDQAAEKHAEGPKALIKKGAIGEAGTDGKTGKAASVRGNQSTTINIKIDSLIKGGFTFNTSGMKENASKIKEIVTQVVLGAVNDSQIIAGQ